MAFRPQIVLFGDSLTEFSVQVDNAGWGALVADHYSRKADVVFRGFGGYNSRWARKFLLDKIFPIPSSNPPLVVTLFFGANDAANPETAQMWMHVPVKEYGENLHGILTHLKTLSDSTRIILITPPPVSQKRLLVLQESVFGNSSGVPIRRNDLVKLYAEECVKVAQQAGVPVINVWSTFQEVPDWEDKLLSDGLHLSSDGNAKLFELLVKVLDELGLHQDAMSLDVPSFLDLEKDAQGTLKMWSSSQ